MSKLRKVAFVPARSGSKRVPNKNIMRLKGHPLIAYTISSAIESGVFDAVICATDSEEYAQIAKYYGAETPFLRSAEISGSKSPDIEWVVWMLNKLKDAGREFDVFSILRPTSPFRTLDTIRRAWTVFEENPTADSLRAVEKCKTHPGKMWMIRSARMLPLLPFTNEGTPWHSSQYATLPEVYEQNASLEIAWSSVALEGNSIAGGSIVPFISEGYEGFDINDHEDWWMAEYLLKENHASLPEITIDPYES